jgi:hypothetical protein
MKWFLILIPLLFVINVTAFGQQKQIYKQGKDLKQYEGEWLGVQGQDTFRIVLKYTERYKIAGTYYVDAILGCYSYSENGTITSSTMQYVQNMTMKYIIMSSDDKGQTFLVFNEEGRKNGKARVSFTLVPGTTNKAIWKIDRLIAQEDKANYIKTKEGLQIQHEDKVRFYPQSKITAKPVWNMTKVN